MTAPADDREPPAEDFVLPLTEWEKSQIEATKRWMDEHPEYKRWLPN